jgi:hypothetical protein
MVLRSAVCCCLLLTSATVPAEALDVVELYTSQGCSTCPPADKLLGELATNPDILALTMPIDYWDYLGWKDSHARPEFTHRQRAYARSRGDNAVFTPQAILNGRAAVIGSRGDEIRETLSGLDRSGDKPALAVGLRIDGDKLVVELPHATGDAPAEAAVWVASYLKPQTVKIGAGENGGQTVTYTNIVDHWQVVTIWSGRPDTVELPLAEIVQPETAGLAVIMQEKHDGELGPILGAARLPLQSGT